MFHSTLSTTSLSSQTDSVNGPVPVVVTGMETSHPALVTSPMVAVGGTGSGVELTVVRLVGAGGASSAWSAVVVVGGVRHREGRVLR